MSPLRTGCWLLAGRLPLLTNCSSRVWALLQEMNGTSSSREEGRPGGKGSYRPLHIALCLLALAGASLAYSTADSVQLRRLLLHVRAGAVRLGGSTLRPPSDSPHTTVATGAIEWLHIPKAGTSFGNTLLLWACPELEPRVWITHEGIVDTDQVPGTCRARFRPDPDARPTFFMGEHISLVNRSDAELARVFTLLRSPRTRLASGFHMIRPEAGNPSAAEICAATAGNPRIHVARGAQTKMVVGEEIRYWQEGTPRRQRFMNRAPATPTQADEACRRLQLFAFVGISDAWNASVCLFHAMHGGEAHSVEFENVRAGSYSGGQGVKEVDCGDGADEQLFACGLELFLHRMEQYPQCIEHLRGHSFRSTLVDAALEEWFAKLDGGADVTAE